jgi:hypothetical protein
MKLRSSEEVAKDAREANEKARANIKAMQESLQQNETIGETIRREQSQRRQERKR